MDSRPPVFRHKRRSSRPEALPPREPRLVIFTGAGISAESGISTFRDKGGLWEGHNPLAVASWLTWRRNFELVHRFYNDRRAAMAGAVPNAAHRAIADWQRRYGAVVITQNVDGLLEKSGCRDVDHVHGRIQDMRCVACGATWTVGDRAWNPETEHCPVDRCRSRRGVKPAVVFFDEPGSYYDPMKRIFQSTLPGDTLVVMGTSGTVIPIGSIARDLPCFRIFNALELIASDDPSKAPVQAGDFDRFLLMPASQALGEIDAMLRERHGPGMDPGPA